MTARIHSPGLSLVFSTDEIDIARKEKKLLSLDIELTKLCNLYCSYCYVPSVRETKDELEKSEIKHIINEAKQLGIRTLNLTGGEPLLYKHYFEIASYACSLGISVLLFTNGTLITRNVASQLMDLQVSPCVKLDSLKPEIQDDLVGEKGSHEKIMKGIDYLVDAGYTTKHPILSVNTTITQKNYHGIPQLWSWLRSKNIIPSLTRLQPMGRAKKRMDLLISSKKLYELYCKVSEIDHQLGIPWDPSIPWVHGKACRRHYIGAFINSYGKVQPCSGLPIEAGNIRKEELGEIISHSRIFDISRNIEKHLEGDCKTCRYKSQCYGCRSIAYHMTNKFTESDPLCWNNKNAF